MRATRIAAFLGLVLFGFGCYLALRGLSVATEVVITVVVLVGMVAGGNLLSGRLGLPNRRGRPAPAGAARPVPVGAHCPGSELGDRAARRAAGAPGTARAEAVPGPEGSPPGTASPGPPSSPPAAPGR